MVSRIRVLVGFAVQRAKNANPRSVAPNAAAVRETVVGSGGDIGITDRRLKCAQTKPSFGCANAGPNARKSVCLRLRQRTKLV